MSKRINLNAGASANGGAGVGVMTTSGNPWTVADALADDLVNRGIATYADAPAKGRLPVQYDPNTGQQYAGDSPVSGAGFSVAAASTTVEPVQAAWTPALAAAARLWYSAEDATNSSGSLAGAGDAVYSIPNRLSTTSRTDSQAMPLVPRTTALGAGGSSNRPVKRNGNLLNGYMPVSFGAVVSGGTTMRLGTQAGALSTNGVHRIFVVAALRGTSFPYLMAVHTTTGNSLAGGNGSRQIRVGTDNQIAGTFTDSTPFMLSYERAGTEPLFDNAVAVSSVLARINGVRTATNTAATSQETADLGFLLGNRGDTDVATDLDFWEVIVCEGKMTAADIHRMEGYLAAKYGIQANLPGDHPYRSAAPTVPVGTIIRADFDVVTAPWGYRQVCQGYLFEIQGDNISANDGAQGADYSRAIPYDLKPSERKRMATLLKGSHSLRLALGLYYRGVRSTNGTSSLQDGIGPRLPSQRQHIFELVRDAGLEGIAPEYWSPPPHFKTTSDFANGTLWAGAAYSRATTLDSIRVSDATQYAAQITALTNAMLADLEDLHSHDTYPLRVQAFGLQNEPLGADAGYGSCSYTATLYLDVLKSLIPKIRSSTKLSSWGGKPNTVQIHATSWGGPADTIGTAIVADATVLSTGKTVYQELAYWTVHQISAFNADANAMLTSTGTSSTSGGQPYYNYRVSSSNPNGIAVAGNEYENFNSPVLTRAQWFANLTSVWINLLNWTKAPLVSLIHAAKPSTDPVCGRYALFGYVVPGDNGAPADADYAGGTTYSEFFTNDVNYNAALPFMRWLKGAQWLQVHEAAYSATKKVGACFNADGKLIVFALNAGSSSTTMTISLGREKRRMRALNYSSTQRDTYADGTDARTNLLTASVPAQTLQVWAEI